jgi:hypothetical protein
MAHTISDRRARDRLKELDPEAYLEQRERPHRERLHARLVVAIWNKRARRNLPPSFFPAIGTALVAKAPILEVYCPGCRTIGEVDLREQDYPPAAPISALIPKLSCRRCCPNPPFATLVALKPHNTLGQRRWIPAPKRPIL